jgi:hypothetical protein
LQLAELSPAPDFQLALEFGFAEGKQIPNNS